MEERILPKCINHKHFLPIYIGMLLFTFLIHISYIPNGFTWLDHRDIEVGRSILPLAQLHLAFFTRFADTGFYRPIVTVLNSVDFALFGKWPAGYHLTNVLLHTVATASLLGFLRVFFSLQGRQLFLAALIFGVHPLSILSVGTISYRPELLLGIFTFLTIFFYVRFRKNPTSRLAIITSIVLLLALLSKETAIVIIPLLILFWGFSQKKPHHIIKKPYQIMIIMLPLLIYGLLRYLSVPELWRISPLNLSLSEAIGTRILGLGKLLLYLISPLKPPLSDAVGVVSITHPHVILTSLGILIFIFLTGYFGVRSAFGKIIVLLFILLSPGLNIIPLPRFTSPHYAYLAVGVISTIPVIIIDVLKGTPRVIFSLLVFVWLLIAIFSTFRSGFLFRDDFTLFQPEVKNDPNFLEGHFYLGKYYLEKGDVEKAGKEYEAGVFPTKGIIAFRDRFLFLINLGGIRLLQNRFGEAEKLYKEANQFGSLSDSALISYNLGLIAYKQKDYKKTISIIENQSYETPEPYILLAKSYYALGKNKEADNAFKKAIPYLLPQQRFTIDSLYNR